MSEREPYPSDVSDEEWAFIAPYLTLLPEDVSQRRHALREVYNGLWWVVRTGASWRMLPPDLPPWPIVYPHTRRWLAAEYFENAVMLLRQGRRNSQSTMAIIDSRTLQSTLYECIPFTQDAWYSYAPMSLLVPLTSGRGRCAGQA